MTLRENRGPPYTPKIHPGIEHLQRCIWTPVCHESKGHEDLTKLGQLVLRLQDNREIGKHKHRPQ